MTPGQTLLLILGLSGLTTLADYFLKLASMNENSLRSRWFVAGTVVYALGAFGWVVVLRHAKLATVGVVYSLATALFLTTLGILVFNESLTRYEVTGVVFGIVAIALLARFQG